MSPVDRQSGAELRLQSSRVELKAIVFPSGDHVGQTSIAPAGVERTSTVGLGVDKAEAVVSGVGGDVADDRGEMPPHAASVVRPIADANPKDVARKRPEACIVRSSRLLHPPSG